MVKEQPCKLKDSIGSINKQLDFIVCFCLVANFLVI